MAEETVTRLVDDLDGSDATQKVLLGLNGEWRALDLSDDNHTALMEAVGRYWDAALPVKGSAGGRQSAARGAGSRPRQRDYDLGILREWAAEQKVAIPARGRIPGSVVERYQAAVKDGWQPKGG